MYNTFRYSEKELFVVQDLIKNREEASNLFYKTYFELEEKKDKMLQSVDISKSLKFDEIDLPKEEILKNRTIAKHMMMPEVILVFMIGD
jgi:hypothetical protein